MKYPNNLKLKSEEKLITYKNRGMNLESDLNSSNNYYYEQQRAFIYKKPTPIKIVEVEYKNNSKVIKKAFFENPSTTDYNGLYKGYYIDFEAKETTSKTSFPLSNIHRHQTSHIRNITSNKGICFLIVRFTSLNETYLLMGNDYIDFIDNNDRSSIPYDYFKRKGYIIKDKYIPRVDYLEIIDKILEVSNNGK